MGPFDLKLPSGAHVHAPVLVRYFGGPEGMLIVPDFGLVKDLSDEIIQAGYGFSVMSEPSGIEEYDRDVFIGVLAEWGWHGPLSQKPIWLKESTDVG